jgi:hypothetical protein
MYIQDSKYYQSFSYVIKVDELFDSYKSIVKNILHPAGTEVFSEYTINNYASISATCSGYYEVNYLYTENNFRLTTESGDPIILDLME